MSNKPSIQTDRASQLSTAVQFAKGVGPDRAELLAKLGLHTVRDLLFFFPRDYQDMSQLRSIDQLEENQPASVAGIVEEIDLRNTGLGKSVLGVLVRQQNSFLRAVWFNQPYLQRKFRSGQQVVLMGTAKLQGGRWEMTHPKIELLADRNQEPTGRVLPVYSLTEGINQSQLRRVVHAAVDQYAELLDEVFPEQFLSEHNLQPIHQALPEIHAPTDLDSLQIARRRFVYQELLVMQLALALRRRQLTVLRQAPCLQASTKVDARILRLFPFELTADQRQAIDEIAGDMGRSVPMNRLLHGDVGSGKTVVAMYAMLLAVAHEHQAALMAPTEVLARQHARTLQQSLAQSRVNIGLLTGSLSAPERRKALEEIRTGAIDIVVGTHAIVHADVQFNRLGLVVIDEQHKFGVRQRAMLRQAGPDPHYLVMTATPIPRTVSMTLYGDLDVSTLRDSPPGRQAVHTYLGDESKRARWWEFFRQRLAHGRQGYVVTPLVDDSSTFDVASVERCYEQLANGELEAFRIDLIHGQMKAQEKEAAMQSFLRGQTQVLVTTSVLEVGIDVPNATLMTIEGGERFGLAQLHQLRGRISRGTNPGYLCVFADPRTEEAQRRLEAIAKSTDGFALAEIDAEMRGPGDLLGTRQHGLPPLRIADLQRDTELLEEARRDARTLIEQDGDLSNPQFARLRRMVLVRYGKALDLGDVG